MVKLGNLRAVTTPALAFGRALSLVCAAALATGLPATASAEDDGAEAPPAASATPPDAQPAKAEVLAHHAPVSVGIPGEQLPIEATFDNAHLIRQAAVVYRLPDGTVKSASFQRSSVGLTYVAVIPAEAVAPPGLDYTIEVERAGGVRTSVFASRERMHHVQVVEARMDAVERTLLKRLGGRRSVVSVAGELAYFGASRGSSGLCPASKPACPGAERRTPEVDERFWKTEFSYTYRPLRTVAEFSLRAGVVRGRSLVPGTLDESRYEVGLNYGVPSVRFRLSDSWHLETELLTSVTEVGFSVGTGASLLIGDPYGTKITLGFETIGLTQGTYFGSRFYSRVDFPATGWLWLAPVIEVTDMPHSERYGVRLVGEATAELPHGFSVALRGGYQAREASSGGVGVGGRVSLAF